jgi:hypothetical protein
MTRSGPSLISLQKTLRPSALARRLAVDASWAWGCDAIGMLSRLAVDGGVELGVFLRGERPIVQPFL